MAEIVFPLNPLIGDVYPVDIPIWVCEATVPSVWSKIYSLGSENPVLMTVADSPPDTPKEGDQWLNTNNNNLYIWYTDSDSSQWVES